MEQFDNRELGEPQGSSGGESAPTLAVYDDEKMRLRQPILTNLQGRVSGLRGSRCEICFLRARSKRKQDERNIGHRVIEDPHLRFGRPMDHPISLGSSSGHCCGFGSRIGEGRAFLRR